jgi:hypothetical protein
VKARVHAALASQLGHPECKLRVRDDLRPLVVETRGRKTLAKRVLISKTITSMKLRERDAFGRVFRVQVEREPYDVGVELAPQLLGDGLAEPAEGSDVVAPDDDRMLGHSSMVP